MTAKTALYGLEYLVEGEPARNTRLALENNAKTIEAALAARGVPPADLQALIAAGWFSDTGWSDLPVAAGFAAVSATDKPQARKIGRVVYLRGGYAITGLAINAWHTVCANVPTAFRPVNNMPYAVGTRQGQEYGQVHVHTTISLRTGPTLSNYYNLAGVSYPVG